MLKKMISVTFSVLLVAYLFFYPLDYYISKPGGAYNTEDFVKVLGGDEDDKGSFSLTTVSMAKATPFSYILASIRDFYDIRPVDEVRQEEEDDEEYKVRQLKMMDDSKFNALYIAFTRAEKPFYVTYKGIYVLNVYEDSAAEGILEPGDIIVEVDNQTIKDKEMLSNYLLKLQKNDKVSVVIEREGQLLTKSISIKEIPNSDGKIGIGISYNESKTIRTEPNVNMDTNEIGGPSAGLMFTLEILNQLVDEDLTKGYDIAGTGEMLTDGKVGRIGGIEKKVVAAHKEGKDYFFAPDDEITDEMKKEIPGITSNYELAKETAKKIGTKMEIVPVQTIDDAINFLNELSPKN